MQNHRILRSRQPKNQQTPRIKSRKFTKHRARKQDQNPYYQKQQQQKQLQTSLKQSFLLSLYKQFDQSNIKPQVIDAWNYSFNQLQKKVFGYIYMIYGPRRSGKMSLVRHALNTLDIEKKQIMEIHIDCQICTTQYQIYNKLFEPMNYKKFDKILQEPTQLDFMKLVQYIVVNQIKYVIIIKNAQNLLNFHKQNVLYNLFEFMKIQLMSQTSSLFLLTKKLKLIDCFQKRIKSRFTGIRIGIFRPTSNNVMIKIVNKRIEQVISLKKKLIQYQENKIQQSQKVEDNEQEEQSNKKNKKNNKTKKIKKQQKQQKKSIYQLKYQMFNEKQLLLEQSLKQRFLPTQIKQFISLNNQGKYDIFQESTLPLQQQIVCLQKLKNCVQKNKDLRYFIQDQLIKIHLIPISFILQNFQQIFLFLGENLIKQLDEKQLKMIIFEMFKKISYQSFPLQSKEYEMIKNFSRVQKILLLIILKFQSRLNTHITLKNICQTHYSQLAHQCFTASQKTLNYSKLTIRRSWQSLKQKKVIFYENRKIWDYPISLLWPLNSIKRAFQKLYQDENNDLSQFAIRILRQIDLTPQTSSYQRLVYNHIFNEDDDN